MLNILIFLSLCDSLVDFTIQKQDYMRKRFLSHVDILHAEEVTTAIARQEIGKWLGKFENLINLLLKVNYFL